MAISCCLTYPLPRRSPGSSVPHLISYFSARIPIVTPLSKKNNWGIVCCSVTSQLVVASTRPSVNRGRGGTNGDVEFCVVTFYKFVSLKDPEAEVAKHQEFLQGRDIHGRIYVNEQGINAQYSGPIEDALAYAHWLKEDPRFSDILVQASPALDGHAFPRLKMRYKPSLLQMASGGGEDPPRKSITSMFTRRKKTTSGSRGRAGTATPSPTPPPPVQPSPDTVPYYSYPSHQPPPTFPFPPHSQSYYYYPGPPPPSYQYAGPSTSQPASSPPLDQSDKRISIVPDGDTFNPFGQPTHKIRDIIRSMYDAPYVSWKKIPLGVRDMWFR